jgi:competence protein ComEA
VLANRIIEYRTEKGEFKSVEDLKKVSGIGDKKFDEIKDKITIR